MRPHDLKPIIGYMEPTVELAAIGLDRRQREIFRSDTGAAVIVPFDDILIAGPDHVGGGDPERAIDRTLEAGPDAVVGFQNTFSRVDLGRTAFICNVTLSFEMFQHTRKFPFGSVLAAVQTNAAAIAVHVNCQSSYREEQFDMLRQLAAEARSLGIPTFGFLYPRGERADGTDENFIALREHDPMAYARLVCEGIQRGVDLGVDAIKTQWTGTIDSFATVVEAAQSCPVVIAGGPRTDTRTALQMAYDAREAGGSGTSFGRNVASSGYPREMTTALLWIVHRRMSVDDAMARFIPEKAR